MRPLLFALGLISAGFLETASAAPSNVDYGRRVAIDACAACHQVTSQQKRPQPVFDADANEAVAAASFAEIASKHGKDGDYLRRKITMPTHPMREQSFDERDLRAIIAYLKSLTPSAKK